MTQTLEELVGGDLDLLYSGALFMTAGYEAAAEDLLVGTLREAFHVSRSAALSSGATDPWLEGRLAKRALVHLRGVAPEGPARGEPFYRGAAGVPVAARVAIWLILLRRWSYAEAADCIGVDRAGLSELLSHRRTLAAVIPPLHRTAGNG